MENKEDITFKKIQNKLEISFATFSFVIAAILILSLYVVAKGVIRQDAREHLLQLASIGSYQIDADAHAGLNGRSNENDSVHSAIQQVLNQIQRTSVDFCHAYTLRFDDAGQLVKVVDAQADSKAAYFEDLYTGQQESLIELLSEIDEPVIGDDFVNNSFGTFLSAYAPFYSSDGRMEGVLCIKAEMSHVLANERHFLFTAILMFIFSTPFIIVFTKMLGHKISVPLCTLERSVERQKALTYIFDAAPVGMIMVDKNKKIKHINNVAARLVGKDTSEVIGKDPGEALNCKYSQVCQNEGENCSGCLICPIETAFQKALQKDEVVDSVEGQITVLDDGKEVPLWLQISVEPVELSGSKHFIMSVTNITDRKQSENLLLQQAQIFEQIQGSVTTADLDGIIASWNKGSEDIFGYSAQEAIGNHVSLVYPAGHEGFLRLKERVSKKGTYEFETELVKKNGKKFFAEITLSLLKGPDGQPSHLVNYCTDITSRKQTEQQLQDTLNEARAMNDQLLEATGRANDMANEASQASVAKTEFLANMSHEIRTPMNGIISMVDLALDKELDEETHGYLSVCKSSANALLAIINDILDFSKIEAGKIDIEIVKSSTQRILIDIDAMMRSRSSKKGVDFDIIFETEIPHFINTDVTRVRQCLLNLVSNALKFTERGSVTIHVSSQTLNDAPAVRFDVKDTGIGITPEQQEIIFDKFSQADSSTTRKFGGTGLGLAITRQLVGLLKGTISVESTCGQGSTFSMTIPANIESGSQPMISKLDKKNYEPDEKPEILKMKLSGNILIAEDDLINQKSISAILSKTDLTFTIVENGQKAVEHAAGGNYALILMDMQMPVMGGIEATSILRDQGIDIPIIALTANVMKQDIDRCVKAGCSTHLAKPINRVKLFTTLAEYLPSDSKSDIAEQQDKAVGQKIEDIHVVTPEEAAIETMEQTLQSGINDKDDSKSDSQSSGGYENVLDWGELVDRFSDEDTIKEIVNAFFLDNPARIVAIKDALDKCNTVELKTISHALKGSSGTIGARLLADAATELDIAAKEADIEKAKAAFADVENEFDRLQELVSRPDWLEIVKEYTVIKS